MRLPADQAIAEVQLAVRGLPVYLTGSAVAAARYDNINPIAYSDVDLFTPSSAALIATVETLQRQGWRIPDSQQRLFQRWLKYGMKGWHTNSIRLNHPIAGVEVNVVYKLVDGHATTSLSQVIESFDFGLLAVGGWDAEMGVWRDMRSYLFPDTRHTLDARALGFMPNKHEAWKNGFISQYNGLRQAGRYVKYVDYGYDLSIVKGVLIDGYLIAGQYLSGKDSVEKQKLGAIFLKFGDEIAQDNLSALRQASKTMLFKDSLDEIMDSLD